MGIFSENAMLYNNISQESEIRESLGEGATLLGTVGLSGDTLTNIMQLEAVMHSMEEYEDLLESDIIQEGVIDNFKDTLKSAITLISKGREDMVKESTAAAKEASDYKSELKKLIDTDKIIKKKMFELAEYRTETYYTGYGSYTQYYYKDPTFSNITIDFDTILKTVKTRDKRSISALKKKYSAAAYEITRWTPTIVNVKIKSDAESALIILANKIDQNKKALSKFEKGTADMKKNLEKGETMLKQVISDKKDKVSPDAKGILKDFYVFVRFQKGLYVHDMKLMHTNNLMILRQSREIKTIVNKFKEK